MDGKNQGIKISPKMLIAIVAVVITASLFAGYMMGKKSGGEKTSLVKPTGRRVLVIGVDGAEWKMMRPLMDEGKLPTFSKLVKEGASGNLHSIKPILSPIIWTSIATGKTPDKHGISWFMVKDPEHAKRFPVQSTMRKTKAIWNILSEQDMKVGVIGWWASFPAERVNGFVVSDYIAYHAFGLSGKDVKTSVGKTYPADIYKDAVSHLIDPLTLPKKEVDRFMVVTDEEYNFSVNTPFDFGNPLQHFMYSMTTGKAYRNMGIDFYKKYDPDWMGVYFEQVDSLSHLYMKYTKPKMDGMSDLYFDKYKGVIENYYIYQDEIIKSFLDEIDENTIVIICSDHGFKTGEKRLTENEVTTVAKAHLWHEIDGVVIMWGPGIKKGSVIEDASVMDITPTSLYLLGAPVADDMDGKVLWDAIDEDFQNKFDIQRIETYENQTPADVAKDPTEENPTIDAAVAAKLKALGYIGDNINDDEIRQNHIHSLLQSGNAAGAEKEVAAVLAKDPESIWARLINAKLLEQKGDTKQAEKIFKELSDEAKGDNINPANRKYFADALQSISVYYHMAGNTSLAIEELKRSLDMFSGNPDAAYNLGVMLEGTGETMEAIKYYEKAVEINPELAIAHNNLGNCYLKVGEIQKAIEEYKITAAKDPNHIECHFNLGVLYRQTGKLDDAVYEFKEAYRINPAFPQAGVALAETLLQTGDTKGASPIIDKLLSQDPNNLYFQVLHAKRLAQKGDIENARKLIQKIKQINPAFIENAFKQDEGLRKMLGE